LKGRSVGRRGVGTLVAACFMLLMLVAAFATALTVQRGFWQDVEAAREALKLEAARARERLEVTKVAVEGGRLSVTVNNTGSSQARVQYLGALNVSISPWQGRYFKLERVLEPGEGAVLTPDAYFYADKAYRIQVVTELGLVYEARYPQAPQVAGWEALPLTPALVGWGSATVAFTTSTLTSYPQSYEVLKGSYLSGTLPGSVQGVDADYFVVSSGPTASKSAAYNPSSYDLLSGSLVSGDVANLASNDQVYMIVEAAPATYADTLYAHSEQVSVAGSSYYMLKTSQADGASLTLSADCSTTGYKLLGEFLYPLRGLSSLPASTWTFYYRAYRTGIPPRPKVKLCVDVLVRAQDGTVRTTIGSKVALTGFVTTSAATLSATYDFPGYTVTDQTDYLEIDYYADVQVALSGSLVYLVIDDPSLDPTLQTRLTATASFPTSYSAVIEFIGSSNAAEEWLSLDWSFDSSYSVGSVSVTLQLYDYANDQYPPSGDGYIAYTSSDTPYTDETVTQTVTVNPARFRGSGGEWKLKLTALKQTDFNQGFQARLDWAEYKPTYYYRYEAQTAFIFSGLSTAETVRLGFELVSQYSLASLPVEVALWNYATSTWDVKYAYTSNPTPDTDDSVSFTVSVGARDYVSGGALKLYVKAVEESDNAVSFQQRVNVLKLTQTHVESSAVYLARGGTSELYVYIPSTGEWSRKADAPFTFGPGSSLSFNPSLVKIYAVAGGGSTRFASYDIASDAWSLEPDTPTPVVEGGFTVYADRLYLCNGTNGWYAYDGSSWTPLGSTPVPSGRYACAEYAGGRVYVLFAGGREAYYSYDPSTGSWAELSPSPHGYPSGIAYDSATGRMYAVSVYGDLYAYDAASDKWFIAEPRPPYANAEGDGDRLVAVSGRLYHVRGGYTRELWSVETRLLSLKP